MSRRCIAIAGGLVLWLLVVQWLPLFSWQLAGGGDLCLAERPAAISVSSPAVDRAAKESAGHAGGLLTACGYCLWATTTPALPPVAMAASLAVGGYPALPPAAAFLLLTVFWATPPVRAPPVWRF